MTTNAAWLDGIQAMTVTGVKRKYDYPPTSLSTADLPASWPLLFDVNKQVVIGCNDLNKTRTCSFYIALEPIAQNRQAVNYEATITMLDNLETAIDALTVMEFVDYRITAPFIINVAGVEYWGVEANLTGSNYSSGGGGGA